MNTHLDLYRAARNPSTLLLTAMLMLGASGCLATPAALEPQAQRHAMEQLLDGMKTRLAAMRQRSEQLLTRVAALPAASTEEAEQARQRRNRLHSVAAQLQMQWRKQFGDGDESVEQLRQRLAEQQREHERLTEELARAKAKPAAQANALPEDQRPGERKPLAIHLVKGRLVPFESPYFSARQEFATDARTGARVRARVISRQRDGEPVAQAIAANGVLDQMLAKAEPARTYVMLRVCADSIAEFRLVAAELARRGFAYSWDTAKDEDIVLPFREPGATPPPAPPSEVDPGVNLPPTTS